MSNNDLTLPSGRAVAAAPSSPQAVSPVLASIPSALSHDEAIDALCGCAATVTVLSYQEAIEGYFRLRDLPIPDGRSVPHGLIHPLLMRAMIVSQIGKECPFPTIKAAADHYGVHPEQLRQYVRGLRADPEPKLLAAFGVERALFYRAASAIETRSAETAGLSPKGESAGPQDDAQLSSGKSS